MIGIFKNRLSTSIWRLKNRRYHTGGTERYHDTIIMWDRYQNIVDLYL
jgi:hypothetical protein